MGHMPELKGLRWEGEMLRQSVSFFFCSPLNDVSPSLLFCRSAHVARSRRCELNGQQGQSPPSSLSRRSGLLTAFTVDIDEAPTGRVLHSTRTLKHLAARAVDMVAMTTGCPASVSETYTV